MCVIIIIINTIKALLKVLKIEGIHRLRLLSLVPVQKELMFLKEPNLTRILTHVTLTWNT